MKTLEDFIKKQKPMRRKSRLIGLKNEIFKLYDAGYQIEQIQEFVEKNGIRVEPITIYKFIEKQKLKKKEARKNFSIKTPVTSLSGDKKFENEVTEVEEDAPNFEKVLNGKELKALLNIK